MTQEELTALVAAIAMYEEMEFYDKDNNEVWRTSRREFVDTKGNMLAVSFDNGHSYGCFLCVKTGLWYVASDYLTKNHAQLFAALGVTPIVYGEFDADDDDPASYGYVWDQVQVGEGIEFAKERGYI